MLIGILNASTMSNESRYITFPIVIMKDGLLNVRKCMEEALYYSCYVYCRGVNGSQADRVKEASKYFGINFSAAVFNQGKILYESIPEYSPKTSISKDMVFEFYNDDKTVFEIVTFLAFAAIRSIIQKQGYSKISNQYLLSRMSGNSLKDEPISSSLLIYNNRYQLDKIKEELQLNWGLKLYANAMRGYYISFRLELHELIEQAELRRTKSRLNKLKEAKKEAYRIAINSIKGKQKIPLNETAP